MKTSCTVKTQSEMPLRQLSKEELDAVSGGDLGACVSECMTHAPNQSNAEVNKCVDKCLAQ